MENQQEPLESLPVQRQRGQADLGGQESSRVTFESLKGTGSLKGSETAVTEDASLPAKQDSQHQRVDSTLAPVEIKPEDQRESLDAQIAQEHVKEPNPTGETDTEARVPEDQGPQSQSEQIRGERYEASDPAREESANAEDETQGHFDHGEPVKDAHVGEVARLGTTGADVKDTKAPHSSFGEEPDSGTSASTADVGDSGSTNADVLAQTSSDPATQDTASGNADVPLTSTEESVIEPNSERSNDDTTQQGKDGLGNPEVGASELDNNSPTQEVIQHEPSTSTMHLDGDGPAEAGPSTSDMPSGITEPDGEQHPVPLTKGDYDGAVLDRNEVPQDPNQVATPNSTGAELKDSAASEAGPQDEGAIDQPQVNEDVTESGSQERHLTEVQNIKNEETAMQDVTEAVGEEEPVEVTEGDGPLRSQADVSSAQQETNLGRVKEEAGSTIRDTSDSITQATDHHRRQEAALTEAPTAADNTVDTEIVQDGQAQDLSGENGNITGHEVMGHAAEIKEAGLHDTQPDLLEASDPGAASKDVAQARSEENAPYREPEVVAGSEDVSRADLGNVADNTASQLRHEGDNIVTVGATVDGTAPGLNSTEQSQDEGERVSAEPVISSGQPSEDPHTLTGDDLVEKQGHGEHQVGNVAEISKTDGSSARPDAAEEQTTEQKNPVIQQGDIDTQHEGEEANVDQGDKNGKKKLSERIKEKVTNIGRSG